MNTTKLGRGAVGVGLCILCAALAWRIGMLWFTERIYVQRWDVEVGAAPWWIFLSAGLASTVLGLIVLYSGMVLCILHKT